MLAYYSSLLHFRLYGILISIKQIPGNVRSLLPHTWVKLTFNGILISVKQILSNVRSLGPHTWMKLTLNGILISVKQKEGYLPPSILY